MTAVCVSPESEGYFNTGVSTDARKLDKIFKNFLLHRLDTARFGNKLVRLENTFVEASVPDWDGYGAQAADYESYLIAKSFLSLITPLNFPLLLLTPRMTTLGDNVSAFFRISPILGMEASSISVAWSNT